MKRSEICCCRMSWGYVVGEMVEFLDEVKKWNLSGMWSELLDVYSCGMIWLSDISGLDLWVVRNKSVVSWEKRWNWWKRWLNAYGLEFKAEYMRNGSNYKRKVKRDWVLNEARKNK